MIRLLLFLTASILVCLPPCPTPAHAKALISDISDHLIRIDTNFKGTDILLFGARNDAGDIVVVVRGPKHGYIVRKKERVAGIWVNREQLTFEGVESFYAVASSRPLSSIKNEELLRYLSLGVHNLSLLPSPEEAITVSITDFETAFLSDKERNDLYEKYPLDIPFMGETLFKLTLHFPKNIPRGSYTVETYLINNGQLTAMQSTPVVVKKIGLDAFISGTARKYPGLYGLSAIALALAAGWIAATLFRKY